MVRPRDTLAESIWGEGPALRTTVSAVVLVLQTPGGDGPGGPSTSRGVSVPPPTRTHRAQMAAWPTWGHPALRAPTPKAEQSPQAELGQPSL